MRTASRFVHPESLLIPETAAIPSPTKIRNRRFSRRETISVMSVVRDVGSIADGEMTPPAAKNQRRRSSWRTIVRNCSLRAWVFRSNSSGVIRSEVLGAVWLPRGEPRLLPQRFCRQVPETSITSRTSGIANLLFVYHQTEITTGTGWAVVIKFDHYAHNPA